VREILLHCGFGLFLGPPEGDDIEHAEFGERPGVVKDVLPTSAGSLEGLVAHPLQELLEGDPDKPRLDEILGAVRRPRTPEQAVPDYDFEFVDWEGDDDCLNGNVVMVGDTTCSADFAPCTSESVVNLSPQTVTELRDFEACNELRAGAGIFVVGSTGKVLFRAGNSIVLENGFEVETGGRFRTKIGPP